MSGMGVMYASMACQVWESGRRGGAPARLRPAEHGLYVNGLLAIYCARRFVTMFSAIIH